MELKSVEKDEKDGGSGSWWSRSEAMDGVGVEVLTMGLAWRRSSQMVSIGSGNFMFDG